MQETVTACPAKALGQNVQHERVEEFFSTHLPCPVLTGFGVKIPEGNHAVFALQDILFLDYAPVEILAEIDDRLVAVTNAFEGLSSFAIYSRQPTFSGNPLARSNPAQPRL